MVERNPHQFISETQLNSIISSVHRRFTYIPDKDELWIHPNNIPVGNFYGDCEEFSLAIWYELNKIGQPSRLALVNINGKNHIIILYDNWMIDNIHRKAIHISKIPKQYKIWKISGSDFTDKWYQLK